MGLSPSEKKLYRQSKQRRRQADLFYKTGKIKPIRSKKPFVIIAVCIVLAALTAAGILLGKSYLDREEPPAAAQAQRSDSLLLRVVSAAYPLDRDEKPALGDFRGLRVNEIMLEDLAALYDRAGENGIELNAVSAYIGFEEQDRLYKKELEAVKKSGDYTEVKASAIARRSVAEAGQSEAQLGMLIEFEVSDPKVKAFLDREGINYGFILRFTKDKEDITRRNASPSVYRYVGKENAEKMRTFNMCLEEFSEYES